MKPLSEMVRVLRRGSAKTHDYTKRGWGHDYTFEPRRGGMEGSMMGWGLGIEAGDFLVLQQSKGGSTRYRVERIEYYEDPQDMWRADVLFAPRAEKEKRDEADNGL